jgi:hypothetical protein
MRLRHLAARVKDRVSPHLAAINYENHAAIMLLEFTGFLVSLLALCPPN